MLFIYLIHGTIRAFQTPKVSNSKLYKACSNERLDSIQQNDSTNIIKKSKKCYNLSNLQAFDDECPFLFDENELNYSTQNNSPLIDSNERKSVGSLIYDSTGKISPSRSERSCSVSDDEGIYFECKSSPQEYSPSLGTSPENMTVIYSSKVLRTHEVGERLKNPIIIDQYQARFSEREPLRSSNRKKTQSLKSNQKN